MFSLNKNFIKHLTCANNRLLDENRRLQERIKDLESVIERLEERNQQEDDFRSGRHYHTEDILKAERFFLRVFSKLRLTISVNDFAKPIIDESEACKIAQDWSCEIPHEDARLWCLQVAKSKYGEDSLVALKFANDLYTFISSR